MVAHYRRIRQTFSAEPVKRVKKAESNVASATLLDLGIDLNDL